MKTYRFCGFALLYLAFQFATFFVAAQTKKPGIAYVNIQSLKQGTFKGSSTAKGFEGKIEVFSVNYDETQAGGKKQLVIEKYFDSSSPQLQQAFATNESLKTVEIQLFNKKADGIIHVIETYRLTNAGISKIDRVNETEKITFVFQKIEVIVN